MSWDCFDSHFIFYLFPYYFNISSINDEEQRRETMGGEEKFGAYICDLFLFFPNFVENIFRMRPNFVSIKLYQDRKRTMVIKIIIYRKWKWSRIIIILVGMMIEIRWCLSIFISLSLTSSLSLNVIWKKILNEDEFVQFIFRAVSSDGIFSLNLLQKSHKLLIYSYTHKYIYTFTFMVRKALTPTSHRIKPFKKEGNR